MGGTNVNEFCAQPSKASSRCHASECLRGGGIEFYRIIRIIFFHLIKIIINRNDKYYLYSGICYKIKNV